MSQPLGVKIVADGQALAVGTWRWGAYTRCASEIVDDLLVGGLESLRVSKGNYGYNLYRVMRHLERRGGVMADNCKMTADFVAKVSLKHGRGHLFKSIDDCDGLFEYYVSDQAFDAFDNCCCGHAVIDLDRRSVSFRVFNVFDRDEWHRFGYDRDGKREIALPCPADAIPFDRWGEFHRFVTDGWDAENEYAVIDGEIATQIL